MGDLFDPAIPFEFVSRVMDTIEHHQQHTFQILTKQPCRMKEFFDQHKWKFFDKTPDFVWLGVTVTNQQDANERIAPLVKTSAGKHFISAEPLLGPVYLDKELVDMLDWVIVGGETGHKARHMQPEWVMDIKEQCEQANTAFFFKSWGGKLKTETIDGKEYKEFPK
jgi:protein gp37